MSRIASSLRVGPLNLRNTSDRWEERAGLLIEQLAEFGPDIIGLQELRRPSSQRQVILDGARRHRGQGARDYRLYPAWKTGVRRWWEGIAILTDLPVERHDVLQLGHGRVAQRVRCRLADGTRLDVVNTHLHHSADGDLVRLAQIERILGWMRRDSACPQMLLGDFNARPDDPAIRAVQRTFRSAHAERHGHEPEGTVPAPVHQRFGDEAPSVIDFIFVNDMIAVDDAWLTFERVSDDDARLSASDHFGVAATISVRSEGVGQQM